jgi:N-acetylglutamate synthase-like GNAT family acetyltransferase
LSYQLRPAAEKDAPTIRLLIRQAGINPLGLDWKRFLLAVDETDRCIGCGQIKPHAGGALELASIAVVPEWRGQGVASMIIQALILRSNRFIQAQEAAPAPSGIYLTCRAGLRSFYERFGFHVLSPGDMPVYFKGAFIAFRILRLLKLARENLLVMHRPAEL